MTRSVTADVAKIAQRVNCALGKSGPQYDFALGREVHDSGAVTIDSNGKRGLHTLYRMITLDATGAATGTPLGNRWLTSDQLREAANAYVASMRDRDPRPE